MATARLSLAQQIALLEEAAPIDLDPEDAHARDLDAQEGPSTDPAAREHYIEVGPSSLRKLHDSVSDPKYDGVRKTRKQIMEEEESGDDEMDSEAENREDGESSGSEVEDDDEDDHRGSSVGGEEDGSQEEGPSESEEEEEDDSRPLKTASPKRPAQDDEPMDDLSSTLRKKREEDRAKGKAVTRQIDLWDSLLDARIRIQKTVTSANRLPAPLDLKTLSALPECQESISKFLKESAALSDELFGLQEFLLDSNESITVPPRKRRKIEADDGPVDYSAWLQDATEDMVALERTYHPHLVQTLSKWSSKIQAVTPSALLPSNRGAFSSKNSQHTKSVLQLIDETLADHSKLVARTRVRRTKGERIGASIIEGEDESPPEDPEIFDDTDFYQQLLRDVIDARGNAAGGADDWMAVQKQKKAKRKVDTKASKGRKIRYEVHEKLQNFMVPVPVIGGWHEEQIDELFASLLGKGFESSVARDDQDEAETRRQQEQLGESLRGGFRVFG